MMRSQSYINNVILKYVQKVMNITRVVEVSSTERVTCLNSENCLHIGSDFLYDCNCFLKEL